MTESTLAPVTPPPADNKRAPAADKKNKQEKIATKKSRPSAIINATLTAATVAGALTIAGMLWVDQKQADRQQQATKAHADQVQQHTQDLRQALLGQMQTLQSRLDDAQAHNQQQKTEQQSLREQVVGLERTVQLFSANSGEAALLQTVEQLVDMAQQQLTLAGNVGQALIALETAQARLARASFPALTPLQESIRGDLERLRALPTQDLAQLAGKLDQLQQLLMQAPLLIDATPADALTRTAPAAVLTQAAPEANSEEAIEDSAQNRWHTAWAFTRRNARQAWDALGHELRQLVSIRRIDNPDALLLSPEQATQLREHLRMRVMTARLALMTAQTPLWQAEMQAIQNMLQTHYDLHTAAGLQTLTLTNELAGSPITLELPRSLNSQQAIQTLLADLQAAPAAQANEATAPTEIPEAPEMSAPAPASTTSQEAT